MWFIVGPSGWLLRARHWPLCSIQDTRTCVCGVYCLAGLLSASQEGPCYVELDACPTTKYLYKLAHVFLNLDFFALLTAASCFLFFRTHLRRTATK